MASQSNLSPESANGGARSLGGRTPPPAPSMAHLSRTKETMGGAEDKEEVQDDQGSPNASTSHRRARAGTLPSSLREGARPEGHAPSASTSDAALSIAPVRTSALSPAYPPQRPALRHAASSVPAVDSPTSRIRSGSLTLPQIALGNGTLSSWSSAAASPLAHALSLISPTDSDPGQADLNFSTLAHLGLTEGETPASMSELRAQNQRTIASNGLASRNRASTVSSFARPLRAPITHVDPYATQYDGQADEVLVQAMAGANLNDPYASLSNFYSASLKDHRSRATTIGALENPALRRNGTRGTHLSVIPQSPNPAHISSQSGGYGYSYVPRTRSRESSRGPRLSVSSQTSRSGTPDIMGGPSTPQVPTRSLWIGNLDVSASSAALFKVFGPYGPIESIRLLPEKTCAFVNFYDRTDAMRARDDVLNRLGGHIRDLSETAPVRIGFGKIDSAPLNPPSAASSTSNMVFSLGSGSSSTVNIGPTPTVLNPSDGMPVGVPMAIPHAGLAAVTVPVVPPPPASLSGLEDQSLLPTRALWVGGIPGSTTSATLLQLFTPFGPVESARVLQHKACGFINFEHLDSAVAARNVLNNREILGPEVGPLRIGYARVQSKTSPQIGTPTSPDSFANGLSTVKGAGTVPTEQQMSAEGGGVENYRSQLVLDLVQQGVHQEVLSKGLADAGEVSEQQMLMQVLGGDRSEEDGDIRAAANYRPPTTYFTALPLPHDRSSRRFDVGQLKDDRRRLDSGVCTGEEADALAMELLDDAADLASDYIGNNIIQKFFELCSEPARYVLLERIAPHLAMIGIHKNGTWAAQKIIDLCVTPPERHLIVSHLRPYAPPLMCDSLGNYVCAGTLRFGPPYHDYVFDAMTDRLWEIAQNRFGARCMRTCLESPYTTLYQKKRISTGIILNGIPLATNPNGALLLTWLVDQSGLPGRYGLLANRFAPHIGHLATHKLASLTVLRIMTQTIEPGATAIMSKAIFESSSDATLIDILSDANNGSQTIGKILAISTLPSDTKSVMTESVRRVLPSIKASSTPPYRLLLEAVGLPVPAGPPPPQFSTRPPPLNGNAQNGPNQWHPQQQQPQQQFYPYNVMGMPNLSPLLVAQNMPLASRLSNSPRVPMAMNGHMGKGPVVSPRTQMLSPGSDPFNPFASPSIDAQFHPINHPPRLVNPQSIQFEQQPNIGGLGFMGHQQSFYQGQGYQP